MSNGPRRPGGNEPVPTTTLRMLRLEPGETEIVRLLSSTYKGCMGHWWKGRTRYCPGSDKCELHNLDAVWKGYCSAERWDQLGSLWVPVVLEISESLDQDFWNVFDRGQVWQVSYPPKIKSKKQRGIKGELWETRPAHTLPEPYDMRPVLLSVYHTAEVRLDLDNPLPRRVTVTPSRDSAPQKLVGKTEEKILTAAEQREMILRARERMKQPSANGKE